MDNFLITKKKKNDGVFFIGIWRLKLLGQRMGNWGR